MQNADQCGFYDSNTFITAFEQLYDRNHSLSTSLLINFASKQLHEIRGTCLTSAKDKRQTANKNTFLIINLLTLRESENAIAICP